MISIGSRFISAAITVPCPPWVTTSADFGRICVCGALRTIAVLAAGASSSGRIDPPSVTSIRTGSAAAASITRCSTPA